MYKSFDATKPSSKFYLMTAMGGAVSVGAVVGVDIGVSSAPQALARNRVNRPNDAAETLKLGLNLIDRMLLLHQNVNPGLRPRHTVASTARSQF